MAETEWPNCELAGEPEPSGSEDACQPELWRRTCALPVQLKRIKRATCAACPVPALLEAVRAANEADKQDDMIEASAKMEEARPLIQTALAAVKRVKERT